MIKAWWNSWASARKVAKDRQRLRLMCQLTHRGYLRWSEWGIFLNKWIREPIILKFVMSILWIIFLRWCLNLNIYKGGVALAGLVSKKIFSLSIIELYKEIHNHLSLLKMNSYERMSMNFLNNHRTHAL